ncbi:2-hydroxychromene-2-carboxylate isomerase [uncultured Roseibium sp.]|uniref:2-hydroxychromene-2-carboxylate isomerase n=1 Tax=uncultured Roseibium sp. TaxID=1936171 RepID=UPI0026157C90|nr:2-hydroxychromene-2-carboxylate isomerase [uncultured Roseibium sp.]
MPVIEYVYSAHSAYAYLGSAELMRICKDHGARLVHRPILLSPVVEAQRGKPFRKRTQQHVDYFFGREIERWAEYRSVPIISRRPSTHDADYSIASGMIIACGESGPETDKMAHALLEAHWRDDADLSNSSTLHGIATAIGLDADRLLEEASSESIQNIFRKNTDWALTNGIFGSPTYIVDGDPFYGQDHLPLVEHALQTPFKPGGWSNPAVE